MFEDAAGENLHDFAIRLTEPGGVPTSANGEWPQYLVQL